MDNREDYLLVCLMEECGELIQASSKWLRHGEDSFNPDSYKNTDMTNRDDFLSEANDVIAILQMFIKEETGE